MRPVTDTVVSPSIGSKPAPPGVHHIVQAADGNLPAVSVQDAGTITGSVSNRHAIAAHGVLAVEEIHRHAQVAYDYQNTGNLSVGWFHKTIKDYIVSGTDAGIVPGGTDNGYNGEYEGFTRLTTANAGTAIVQGWEFSYQQQFTFLPSLLKGLGGSANYTVINTHGNFGGANNLRTGEVANFIPKAANVSLSWRYRGFSSRVLYNFTGAHITSYSATSPALNLYRFDRNTVNLGLAYQVRPSLTLTCDVSNVFNEPQRLYSGIPDRVQDIIINFVTITVGVSGRF